MEETEEGRTELVSKNTTIHKLDEGKKVKKQRIDHDQTVFLKNICAF